MTLKGLLTAAILACCAASAAAGPREPDTVITGDQMEIIKGGETVVFSGDARVTRGSDRLSADRLVQNKKGNYIEAFGSVDFKTVTQDNEPVSGRAERGQYHPDQGWGELTEGRPTVVYQSVQSTGPVRLTADRIRFDRKADRINAAGQVEIVTSSATALAPSAVFLQKDRKVVMTGGVPQARIIYTETDRTGDYQADRITVYLDRRRVLMEGRVAGVVSMPDTGAEAPRVMP